jgi:hypothetical protein
MYNQKQAYVDSPVRRYMQFVKNWMFRGQMLYIRAYEMQTG